jgi:hypothetical protein
LCEDPFRPHLTTRTVELAAVVAAVMVVEEEEE